MTKIMLINHLIFLNTIRRLNTRKIVFIDIDNTIASTWPTLVNRTNIKETERLSNLKPLTGTINHIRSNYSSNDYQRIFLSHRPLRYFFLTKKWLMNNNIFEKNDRLFLVRSVNCKVWYFSKAQKAKLNVTVIDDLSYNHENREVKFYSNIIDEIFQKNIRYLGYDQIVKFNV